MKKKFKLIPAFALSVILLGVILFFSSYKSEVQMYGKAVFPTIFNIDNAHGKKELNGHVRGDSASGYQLWARNYHGTEFPIMGGNGDYIQKELFTGENTLQVGDTAHTVPLYMYLKKITPTNDILFNHVEYAANLRSDPEPAIVITYVLDSALKVTRKDTVFNSDAAPFEYRSYNSPISEVTLRKGKTYYVGFYTSSDDSLLFPGNKYYNTSSIQQDSTWMYRNTFGFPPDSGQTVMFSGVVRRSFNFRFYYQE